jgi:hypothetical protein
MPLPMVPAPMMPTVWMLIDVRPKKRKDGFSSILTAKHF